MAVYFLRCIVTGLVKIGFTDGKRPGRRIRSLMAQGPTELKLVSLVPGSRLTEKELHKRFTSMRVIGEWFRLNDSDIPPSVLSVSIGRKVLKNKVMKVEGDFVDGFETRMAARKVSSQPATEDDVGALLDSEGEPDLPRKKPSRRTEELMARLMEPLPEPVPDRPKPPRETWEQYQARVLASGRVPE